MLLFSVMILLSSYATSLGRLGPGSAWSVVEYAIASHAAAPWVTGVTVGNALPTMSGHYPLMLSLAHPALLSMSVSTLPSLYAHWELGAQAF